MCLNLLRLTFVEIIRETPSFYFTENIAHLYYQYQRINVFK
jgi:hypothetical protein